MANGDPATRRAQSVAELTTAVRPELQKFHLQDIVAELFPSLQAGERVLPEDLPAGVTGFQFGASTAPIGLDPEKAGIARTTAEQLRGLRGLAAQRAPRVARRTTAARFARGFSGGLATRAAAGRAVGQFAVDVGQERADIIRQARGDITNLEARREQERRETELVNLERIRLDLEARRGGS